MDDGSMNFLGAARPPAQLPSQFASLPSISASQADSEPVDLVCSEDSSSLGVYRSFHRLPKGADISMATYENTTNFCLGNSGEFLHKVISHQSCFCFAFDILVAYLPWVGWLSGQQQHHIFVIQQQPDQRRPTLERGESQTPHDCLTWPCFGLFKKERRPIFCLRVHVYSWFSGLSSWIHLVLVVFTTLILQ
jgi:hypothetical protein